MLEHSLGVCIGDQEGNVITLVALVNTDSRSQRILRTGTGFLLSTMKLSARWVMNLVNLWARILSISSACLILMLTRTEFTEGSMNTRSFSLREMVRGLRRTSRDVLWGDQLHPPESSDYSLNFDLWLVVPFHDLHRGHQNPYHRERGSCAPETQSSRGSRLQ